MGEVSCSDSFFRCLILSVSSVDSPLLASLFLPFPFCSESIGRNMKLSYILDKYFRVIVYSFSSYDLREV